MSAPMIGGMTPQPESVERADCPVCGYPGLRKTENGLMLPHRRKGSSRAPICPASETVALPPWERY